MANLLAQLTVRLRGFVAWWFGELAALVPARVRKVFHRERETLVLEFADDEVVVGHEAEGTYREIGRLDTTILDPAMQRGRIAKLLRKVRLDRVTVAIRLAATQVLQKTVSLPLAAEENLRQVLSFEMDRHTPFGEAEVYYDYRVRDRDAETQRIEVELAVVPRTVVEGAVEKAVDWGLQPEIVDVAGDTSPAGAPFNLLPHHVGPSRAGPGSRWTIALAGLAAILLAAAVYIPLDQERRAAEGLRKQVAEAKSEAESANRLREEIDRLIKDSRFLMEMKRRSPTVTEILDELTRLLPDDTWLSQLQLRGSEILVAGYSATASALIGLIEQSPLLHNAKFRSIVTQDPKVGLERFNLSAEVVGEVGR